MSDLIGLNVKKLIARKMALDAVPRGGGLNSALSFLASKDAITEGARHARDWVKSAIVAVRSAGEPNPWKDADDETIAGHLLEQIAKRESE